MDVALIIALMLAGLIGMVCRSIVKQRAREQAEHRVLPINGWMTGDWPMTWWCKSRGHRAGKWRPTYQPHVRIRYCSRCGAFECRSVEPKRLP